MLYHLGLNGFEYPLLDGASTKFDNVDRRGQVVTSFNLGVQDECDIV